MRNKKRAIRRHHRERILTKRYNQLLDYHWGNIDDDEDWLDYAARLRLHTPCQCSCWGCGNPRRHKLKGESLTLQERRNLISFEEQVEVD